MEKLKIVTETIKKLANAKIQAFYVEYGDDYPQEIKELISYYEGMLTAIDLIKCQIEEDI
jgi:hypothetical protein